MNVRDQDRIGLYAVGTLVLLAIAMCLSALFGAPARNGGCHAAAWVNPRGSEYELSQRLNRSNNCANASQIFFETPWHGSVPAHERGVSSVPGNALQGMFGSNPNRAPKESGAPARPVMGTEAGGSRVSSLVKRGDDGGKTPRSCATGIQHSENAGKLGGQYPPWKCTETRPKLPVDRTRTGGAVCARAGASRRRDFAGGRETSCTLVVEQSAHLRDGGKDRRRSRAERVTRSRDNRGPIGARSTFAQRTPSYTGVTGGERAASMRGRAVVARLAHNQEVAGSTPALATRSAADAKTAPFVVSNGCDQSRVAQQDRKTPGLRSQDTALAVCTVDPLTAGETASGNGKNLVRSVFGRRDLDNPTEGGSPSCSATPKPGIAQQQESATRLASVALRVTGSAAARPGSIRGAA